MSPTRSQYLFPFSLSLLIFFTLGACLVGVDGTGEPGADLHVRTGNFPGPDGTIRAPYIAQGDNAVVGGDMLWPLESAMGIDDASAGPLNRWSGGVIPYEFEPGFTNQASFTTAVAAWNSVSSRTGVSLVQRSAEKDYLRVVSGKGCTSYVGRQGGAQELTLNSSSCGSDSAIHAIGHALGMIHEHSRPDRDSYIRIDWLNLVGGKDGNFAKLNLGIVQGATNYSQYDTRSIMHYEAALSSTYLVDSQEPMFKSLVSGVSERDFGGATLSQGDVTRVAAMYKGFRDGVGGSCSVAACSEYHLQEGSCKSLSTGTYLCANGCMERSSSCSAGESQSSSYTCTNGAEIPASYHCDGISDCPDGGDESGCTTTSKAEANSLIDCTVGGNLGECIDTSSMTCLGQLHTGACAGGSNIRCCTSGTSSGGSTSGFTCTSGQQIPADYKCDGIPDCSDGSDEASCDEPAGENGDPLPTCTVNGNWGTCINTTQTTCFHQLYTGACPGSAEIQCCAETTGSGGTSSTSYQCTSGEQIPADYKCDGISDCQDNSDEKSCGTTTGDDGSQQLETCTAGGEFGECINTYETSCLGQLHTGACSGAANIRCCT